MMNRESASAKRRYSFFGTVLVYGRVAAWDYSAETRAVNEKKANSNMAYQFRKNNNLANHVPVKLQGVISTD